MTKTQMLLGMSVSTLAIIGCAVANEHEGSRTSDVGAQGQLPVGERASGAKTTDEEKKSGVGGDEQATDKSEFDREIQSASTEFNVPAAVLKAIAWTETRYAMVEGTEELGRPAVFGVMALGGERLQLGASLAHVEVESAKHEALANIRAAAALLSSWADEAKIGLVNEERMNRVAVWEPVIARYAGIEEPNARNEYVKDHVYGAMRKGLGVAIKADPSYFDFFAEESVALPTEIRAAGPDYAASIWRSSPNFNSRNGSAVGMVIIHTCEGGYSGCWGWLANSQAQASAHYVVREDGMEISQLVRESSRAWHIAATYDCARNSNVECFRNGTSSNNFTIGIEHAGFASQSSFPTGQIEASAKLVCDISRDHGIPRDRFHIVGHGKLQPWDRTDPGPNWPWARYIQRVDELCGGATPPPPPPPPPPPGGGGGDEIVIDSNNANNDLAKAKAEVSGNWTGSANVSGFYGSGYYWADAAPVADGAVFWFWLPADATKTVEAHWTAATDRSTKAPFVMFDAHENRVGAVQVNQQANGGRWNSLGSYAFTAGWNKVVLSRWTATGSIVVADAVRVH